MSNRRVAITGMAINTPLGDTLDGHLAALLAGRSEHFCGDGILDPGEECDHGDENHDNAQCTSSCMPASCGDGFKQPGEECDLGDENLNTGDCTETYTKPSCGDGFTQPDEQCDNGPDNGTERSGRSLRLGARSSCADILQGQPERTFASSCSCPVDDQGARPKRAMCAECAHAFVDLRLPREVPAFEPLERHQILSRR